jgi:hypothetical protein
MNLLKTFSLFKDADGVPGGQDRAAGFYIGQNVKAE